MTHCREVLTLDAHRLLTALVRRANKKSQVARYDLGELSVALSGGRHYEASYEDLRAALEELVAEGYVERIGTNEDGTGHVKILNPDHCTPEAGMYDRNPDRKPQLTSPEADSSPKQRVTSRRATSSSRQLEATVVNDRDNHPQRLAESHERNAPVKRAQVGDESAGQVIKGGRITRARRKAPAGGRTWAEVPTEKWTPQHFVTYWMVSRTKNLSLGKINADVQWKLSDTAMRGMFKNHLATGISKVMLRRAINVFWFRVNQGRLPASPAKSFVKQLPEILEHMAEANTAGYVEEEGFAPPTTDWSSPVEIEAQEKEWF